MVSEPILPVQREEAYARSLAIADPVTRNLVGIGMGAATVRFLVLLSDDGEPLPRSLPAASLDMAFFVEVLAALCAPPARIAEILAGAQVPPVPAVASAWALNEAGADEVRASVSDPVVRNLVTAALNEARARLRSAEAAAGAPGSAALPCLPFDMQFFASVVRAQYRPELLGKLLRGMSVEEASGWI